MSATTSRSTSESYHRNASDRIWRLLFIDHLDLMIDDQHYVVLVVVDGMPNFVWVGAQAKES
eukprot:12901009-Prorocentrum_lima.AAC.1